MGQKVWTTTADFSPWLGARAYLNTLRLKFNDVFVGAQTRAVHLGPGNTQDGADLSGLGNDATTITGGTLGEYGYTFLQGNDAGYGMGRFSCTGLNVGASDPISLILVVKPILPLSEAGTFMGAGGEGDTNILAMNKAFTPSRVGGLRLHNISSGGVIEPIATTTLVPDEWVILWITHSGSTGNPVIHYNHSTFSVTSTAPSGTPTAGAQKYAVFAGLGTGAHNVTGEVNQFHYINGVIGNGDISPFLFITKSMQSDVIDTTENGSVAIQITPTVSVMPSGGGYRVRARGSDTPFLKDDLTPAWGSYSSSETTTQTLPFSGVSGRYLQVEIEGTPESGGLQINAPVFSDVTLDWIPGSSILGFERKYRGWYRGSYRGSI